MRGKKYSVSLLWLLFWGIQMGYSQCNTSILETVGIYSDPKHLGVNELFEYDITLQIKPIKDRPEVRKSTKMSILIGHNIYVNNSEYARLYADSVQMFSVSKNSKMIVWQDFERKATQMFSPKELFKQIDSLVCVPKTVEGKIYTQVTCFLKKGYSEKEKIVRVEYLLDMAAQKVYKAKVLYKKESGIDYIEMVYNIVTKIPCPEHLKGNIKNIFFEKGTKVLKPAYIGYHLTDQRKARK